MKLPSQSLVGAGALGKRGRGHLQTWTLVLPLLSLPDGFDTRILGLCSVLDTSCHSSWQVTLWVSVPNMQSRESSMWWLWCILRNKESFKEENRNHRFSIASVNYYCCCCCVVSVMSNSVRPYRQKPTRLPRPWDSPGKNTGVGCHFLLQCMKVKSESEVA